MSRRGYITLEHLAALHRPPSSPSPSLLQPPGLEHKEALPPRAPRTPHLVPPEPHWTDRLPSLRVKAREEAPPRTRRPGQWLPWAGVLPGRLGPLFSLTARVFCNRRRSFSQSEKHVKRFTNRMALKR